MTGLQRWSIDIVVAASWLPAPVIAADRPNIIYIMADDLGYADVGCFGQKQTLTPNIDRMAAEGTRFTQFYAGSTVCAPTRCCLMTGMHTGHAWIRGNNSGLMKAPQGRVPLRPEDVTVAEVLKTAGYTTGIVGKWGLGEPETDGIPNRQGFDFWFGYLNQAHAHSYYPDYLWKNEEEYPLPGNRDGGTGQYSHDLMTREALGFIERNKDKPFFLYLPYTIPHAKLEVPSDAPYSDRDWPQAQKNFAAMITRMDGDIGKLMQLLVDLDLDEKTLVMFTSDNGPHSEGGGKSDFFDGNGPLRGMKRDLYEGGIRVPLVVRWPGKVNARIVSDHVWAMWDVLPTMAELVGAEAPDGIDGMSMLPAIYGNPCRSHDFLYWEYPSSDRPAQAVRTGDWKAVRNPGKPTELYNLAKDIGETTNVAGEHPDLVAKAEKLMETQHTPSKYWPTKEERS